MQQGIERQIHGVMQRVIRRGLDIEPLEHVQQIPEQLRHGRRQHALRENTGIVKHHLLVDAERKRPQHQHADQQAHHARPRRISQHQAACLIGITGSIGKRQAQSHHAAGFAQRNQQKGCRHADDQQSRQILPDKEKQRGNQMHAIGSGQSKWIF